MTASQSTAMKLTETQEGLLAMMHKNRGVLAYETLRYVNAGTVKALERRGLIELAACNYYLTETGEAEAARVMAAA